MKIIAIIQARMGSSRLPGKVLLPIVNKPVLWHIVKRLERVERIDSVVVATSDLKKDDSIQEFCELNSIKCFRGDEKDVLDRFYSCAKTFDADHLIRVTGDCPVIDPTIISQLIEFYFNDNYDHCGVAIGAGVEEKERAGRYPDGLDTEIFSMKALKKSWKEANGDAYREHVTPYMWKNDQIFKLGAFKHNKSQDISFFRWTLDHEEDFKLISWIYEQLYSKKQDFGLDDILELAKNNITQFKTNQHLFGNIGYEQFWK